MAWAPPVLAENPEPESGPVMVTIEYRVDPAKRAEFVAAMQEVREMRRRNGAYYWELYHDSANPAHFVETFMDESWIEHMRQHERVSVADREVQRRARNDPIAGLQGEEKHWTPGFVTYGGIAHPLQWCPRPSTAKQRREWSAAVRL